VVDGKYAVRLHGAEVDFRTSIIAEKTKSSDHQGFDDGELFHQGVIFSLPENHGEVLEVLTGHYMVEEQVKALRGSRRMGGCSPHEAPFPAYNAHLRLAFLPLVEARVPAATEDGNASESWVVEFGRPRDRYVPRFLEDV
jgi:hypothetical protein